MGVRSATQIFRNSTVSALCSMALGDHTHSWLVKHNDRGTDSYVRSSRSQFLYPMHHSHGSSFAGFCHWAAMLTIP